MDDKPYLVPRAVTARTELFPGFGFAELGLLAAGGALGLLLFLILHAFGVPLPPCFIVAVIPTAAGYFAGRADPHGVRLLAYVTWAREWMRRPKLWLYVQGTGGDAS